MYKIGITGSIGTGKTTIANIFAYFGIPVFDADKEVKKLLNQKKIKKKIENTWPKIVIDSHIDKSKLKTIIFSNKKDRKKLERILYPYLKVEKVKFEVCNCRKQIVAYDIPLIYETRSDKDYDLVLLTNCDIEVQRKRVIDRDKITNSLYNKIVKSQLSFKEKIKFNPKIVNTNNSKLIIFVNIALLLTNILIGLRVNKWKKKEN